MNILQEIFLDSTNESTLYVEENRKDFFLDSLITVGGEDQDEFIYTLQTDTEFFNVTSNKLMVLPHFLSFSDIFKQSKSSGCSTSSNALWVHFCACLFIFYLVQSAT